MRSRNFRTKSNIEIIKRINDRALRVRECEAYLGMAVNLPSEPNDLRKEFSCFIEKRFRIL
jgi:hypothetical protein